MRWASWQWRPHQAMNFEHKEMIYMVILLVVLTVIAKMIPFCMYIIYSQNVGFSRFGNQKLCCCLLNHSKQQEKFSLWHPPEDMQNVNCYCPFGYHPNLLFLNLEIFLNMLFFVSISFEVEMLVDILFIVKKNPGYIQHFLQILE